MKTISTLLLAAAFLLARPAFAGVQAERVATPKAASGRRTAEADKKAEKKAEKDEKKAEKKAEKDEKKADKGGW